MKKIFICLLILVSLLGSFSCKKNKKCKHVDDDLNCICDKCNDELDHNYVDGFCEVCGKVKDNSKKLEGSYVLNKATLGSEDVTNDFSFYQVRFVENMMEVKIYKNGFMITRVSEYYCESSVIYEKYQNERYSYTIFQDQLLTTYDDLGDEVEVILKIKKDGDEVQPVDFNDVLFGESLSLVKIYNYCPAVIYDKNEKGEDIMHVWYCTNKDSGVIMDYIGYRLGTKQEDGKWIFSDQQIVLSPTEGTWDARHTCDPSVIKGEFNYKGTSYCYLMAYLGCTTEDYQKNETGLAVSNSPTGPWVKIDEVNPIVPWYDDGNIDQEEAKYQSYKGTSTIYWGTGMPSLVSIDGKGEVLMFYASTKRGIGIRRLDLSNIEHPVEKFVASLTDKNVTNSQGLKGRIAIPDFGYDPVNKRFYVASVTNEKNPADVTLTRVNSHSFVAYIDNMNSMEEVCETLKNGDYSWNIVGFIGPGETGWERNHNPGLVKDNYGYIPNSNKVGVIVSTGHNSWGNENIFTYRLFGYEFEIKKD